MRVAQSEIPVKTGRFEGYAIDHISTNATLPSKITYTALVNDDAAITASL